MKWSVFVCVALLIATSFWLLQDRNGRVYKKVAKLVRPILSQPVTESELSLPFVAEFSALLEGDDAWTKMHFDTLLAEATESELMLRSSSEAVWWKNWQGPGLFHYVSGDFEASIRVRSEQQSHPGQDVQKAFQFGGLILRDPMGDKFLTGESYVFNVVGHRGESGVQVETKSTRDGWSDVSGFDWPRTQADLKIIRNGAQFSLFAKTANQDSWRELLTYDRPDLPEQLQIGIIAYAYSGWSGYHDLLARFADLTVVPR